MDVLSGQDADLGHRNSGDPCFDSRAAMVERGPVEAECTERHALR
jgi:hypothetical protein